MFAALSGACEGVRLKQQWNWLREFVQHVEESKPAATEWMSQHWRTYFAQFSSSSSSQNWWQREHEKKTLNGVDTKTPNGEITNGKIINGKITEGEIINGECADLFFQMSRVQTLANVVRTLNHAHMCGAPGFKLTHDVKSCALSRFVSKNIPSHSMFHKNTSRRS